MVITMGIAHGIMIHVGTGSAMMRAAPNARCVPLCIWRHRPIVSALGRCWSESPGISRRHVSQVYGGLSESLLQEHARNCHNDGRHDGQHRHVESEVRFRSMSERNDQEITILVDFSRFFIIANVPLSCPE